MSNTTRPTLKIEDFSRSPGGRERSDGNYSGEEYRQDVIIPALKRHDEIAVDLRGVKVLIPSFIDEAFGPLIQDLGADEFRRKVHLIYREGSILDDIIRETFKLRSTRR